MDLAVTDEQRALREVMRDFAEKHSTDADVRRLMDGELGYDPAAWAVLGARMGVVGLAVPEEYGGGGAGFRELSTVVEELGRRLFGSPLLASAVLATQALLAGDDEAARREFLPAIAAGDSIGTVAWVESPDDWGPGPARHTQADPAGDGWVLTGRKLFVLDGGAADLILVTADTADGPGLFAVHSGGPGLDRRTEPTLDQTRRLATLTFDRVPARRLSTMDVPTVVARMVDAGVVALAAEQVGVAEFALEQAVEYAKSRIQFGRPIGSFQAVKHRCADMLVAVEAARSAAAGAAAAIATRAPDAGVLAAVARTVCAPACTRVTADAVQIYGGIGFTWEHPAHLYFKRARSNELLFGPVSHWRAVLADRLAL